MAGPVLAHPAHEQKVPEAKAGHTQPDALWLSGVAAWTHCAHSPRYLLLRDQDQQGSCPQRAHHLGASASPVPTSLSVGAIFLVPICYPCSAETRHPHCLLSGLSWSWDTSLSPLSLSLPTREPGLIPAAPPRHVSKITGKQKQRHVYNRSSSAWPRAPRKCRSSGLHCVPQFMLES